LKGARPIILLLFCLIISTALGFAGAYAIDRIARRWTSRTAGQWTALAAGLLVTAALFLPVTNWMTDAVAETVIGMDPHEAAKRLDFLGLPDHATSDICYRMSPVGITVLAAFDMPEEEFLAWMKSRNWNVVTFDLSAGRSLIHVPDPDVSFEPVVYPVRQFKSRTPLPVKHGYCYFTQKADNPDNTDRVIYDLDSGRVYVQCTTH